MKGCLFAGRCSCPCIPTMPGPSVSSLWTCLTSLEVSVPILAFSLWLPGTAIHWRQVDDVCSRGKEASHLWAHLMLLSFLQATKSTLVNSSQRARSLSWKHDEMLSGSRGQLKKQTLEGTDTSQQVDHSTTCVRASFHVCSLPSHTWPVQAPDSNTETTCGGDGAGGGGWGSVTSGHFSCLCSSYEGNGSLAVLHPSPPVGY